MQDAVSAFKEFIVKEGRQNNILEITWYTKQTRALGMYSDGRASDRLQDKSTEGFYLFPTEFPLKKPKHRRLF